MAERTVTRNAVWSRTFDVAEDVGRIWPPPRPYVLHLLSPFRFCASLFTDYPDGSKGVVIANAWTRAGAIREARRRWFEQARLVSDDDECSIVGLFSRIREQGER